MPKLPILAPTQERRGAAPRGRQQGVLLAVYAPIGTDERLSRYPSTNPAAPIAPIHKQALVRALQKTAAEGVNVCALVDVFDDDTYLVEIPAFKPEAMSTVSAWKQDMSDRHALTGFLRRAHQRFPCDALVLAIEGHGGGFVPDLDLARITTEGFTRFTDDQGQPHTAQWVRGAELTRIVVDGGAKPRDAGADEGERPRQLISPELNVVARDSTPVPPDDGDPQQLISPELQLISPELPASRLPLSTWAYGEALRQAIKAGVPKPAVIHFNNCFNASLELLHTVAPYAAYASAYANYDFFTAGEAYPAVFRHLRLAGSATAEQLAKWFVLENGALLQARHHHPIVGATVALRRMPAVATALNRLGATLAGELRGAQGAAVRAKVRQAAIDAQHYDTEPGYELKVPDQYVDVGSFAAALQAQFGAGPVQAAAGALATAVAGFWQFGDKDWPWMANDPGIVYDFKDQRLGLNVFFPDPALAGRWDWRSPYYLSGRVDPSQPPAHRHVIALLAERDGVRPAWVDFIVEYHQKTKFEGFFPARAPVFPVFNPKFDPKPPKR